MHGRASGDGERLAGGRPGEKMSNRLWLSIPLVHVQGNAGAKKVSSSQVVKLTTLHTWAVPAAYEKNRLRDSMHIYIYIYYVYIYTHTHKCVCVSYSPDTAMKLILKA